MENRDQKENSGQETISDIKKNIDRLKDKFEKTNNLKALKKDFPQMIIINGNSFLPMLPAILNGLIEQKPLRQNTRN